jgi:hypothetical protein
MYYGAIAMTYEQASVRGLALRRTDGSVLTFRDTVRHHFVASLSTLEAAAANREKLLGDFYHYRATAIDEGRKEPVVEYILPRGRDASATDKLAGILMEHGIEVQRAKAAFRSGEHEWPAGTYIVPMAQPSKRLIRTLLDPQIPMDAQFVEAEEARRRVRQRSEIYDVTAWSLPLLFNVEAVPSRVVSQGEFEPAPNERFHPGEMHGAAAKVAYLAQWGSEAAGRLLIGALRQDLKVHSSERAFALNGVKFPSGSLIFKVAGNPADLANRLAQLARESGADIYATDTGWVEDGVNFGSHYVVPVKKPAIAMAWDLPVSSASAGAARFVLERQYGFPVTPIRTSELNTPELSRFEVLILPDGGSYSDWMSDGGVRRLKEWVQAGGTVVALGNAVNFLAEKEVALLDTAQENAVQEEEKKPAAAANGRVPGSEIASAGDYDKLIHAATSLPDSAPGAIVKARVQADHWLTAGAGDSVYAMVEGRAIFTPLKLDKGVNAVYFEAADQLLASGYLWSENRKQMAFKPLVAEQNNGRGVVVGFTADPNFRGIQDGMNVLFLNAVFRGPSHAR